MAAPEILKKQLEAFKLKQKGKKTDYILKKLDISYSVFRSYVRKQDARYASTFTTRNKNQILAGIINTRNERIQRLEAMYDSILSDNKVRTKILDLMGKEEDRIFKQAQEFGIFPSVKRVVFRDAENEGLKSSSDPKIVDAEYEEHKDSMDETLLKAYRNAQKGIRGVQVERKALENTSE